MEKKLFCEIAPFTYKISVLKCCALRHTKDFFSKDKFAKTKSSEKLPYVILLHNSLIRRRLGNTDIHLQENKALNLSISAPKVSGILIRPGETFSFWRLVGKISKKMGYKEGLVISNGKVGRDIGGGMCQFTNLIHWMVLHSNLTITEHHHHDGLDLFPDFGRQIPFGTGTSIFYNYIDYRFKNNTDFTYQIIVYTTDKYLCGELRLDKEPEFKYHIYAENEYFSKEPDGVYRNGTVKRKCVDIKTGNTVSEEIIRKNHAKVMYDTSELEIRSDLNGAK
ncbi:MAG: VanW family protein [Lachnospiraceae bacterium]|nr:VanW family protein [Lachnospiraceae bacterium]